MISISLSADVSDRRTSDLVFVQDMLDAVFDMKVDGHDITKMYRLGQWTEDKPRPVLVAFRDFEQKENIMANLQKFSNRPKV